MQDQNDSQAAGDFVRRYRPVILEWCRTQGVQMADAEDVAQVVTTKLVVETRLVNYEKSKGSFRHWLWHIVKNAVRDALKARARPGAGSGDEIIWDQLNAVSAQESLRTRLNAVYDLELQQRAFEQVAARVLPETWKIFVARSLENVSAKEVATRMGRSPAAVHMANSRVLHLIQECIQELENEQLS
jgi:RNA polymerase sigma-70 factor (ECF subfamily)